MSIKTLCMLGGCFLAVPVSALLLAPSQGNVAASRISGLLDSHAAGDAATSAARLPAVRPAARPDGLPPIADPRASAALPPQDADTVYPFYLPMDGLLPVRQTILLDCRRSNAAGEYRTRRGRPADFGAGPHGSYEIIFEAFEERGCVFTDIGFPVPPREGRDDYRDGAQIIYRSSVPGSPAKIVSGNMWHNIHLKVPHRLLAGRFHIELRDIDFEATSRKTQKKGALQWEVYPPADSGKLATLVVRRSSFQGQKNGLFATTGASMLYAEDSQFGRNLGKNVGQVHAAYVNALISSHFRNVRFYGARAGGRRGGHQLKDKSILRILEDVTLDNRGSDADPSPMPLADFTAWGWTWSDGLTLIRERPARERPPTLIDLRRRYYADGRRLSLPWPSAEGFEMPFAPGECGPLPEGVYLHVFRGTKVASYNREPFIVRNQGTWATSFDPKGYGGVEPANSYSDVMANPRRNRTMVLTFDTTGNVDRGSSPEGYWYERPSPPAYVCDDPVDLSSPLAALAGDRDRFIRTALEKIDAANGRLLTR